MRRLGVDLVFDNQEIAVTGISEVLSKIPSILKAYRTVKKTLKEVQPDLLILLDFPDFNLWAGRAARSMGVPVLYYISPQVWAWRKGRISQIQRLVEKIMVILPFEASLYGDKGVFVGHPLLDVVRASLPQSEVRERFGIGKDSRVVALLPGSRKNEVRQLLPVLAEAAHLISRQIPNVEYLIPVALTVPEEEIKAVIRDARVPIHPVWDHIYDAIALSDFAVVASGTATLEMAILGVPMVIVYKVSKITYLLAKRLVRVPHIGLINMVAGERVVPELIQDEATSARVAQEAVRFLQDRKRSEQVSARLSDAVSRLGDPGASDRAAQVVLECMEMSR